MNTGHVDVQVLSFLFLDNSICFNIMHNNNVLCSVLHHIQWITLHVTKTIARHLAYQMIYHRNVTTFARCCNNERVEIRCGTRLMYQMHVLVQQFQYFPLTELNHCSIKVCDVRDVIARVKETSELVWMFLHIILEG